jgi:hypothetical protein
VLSDLAEVEPLLRRSADLVLTTTAPLPDVADRLITRIAEFGAARSRGRPRALLEGRSRTYPRFRRACLGGVAAGANCQLVLRRAVPAAPIVRCRFVRSETE